MGNIIKIINEKMNHDIRFPFEANEEREKLWDKYGENTIETYFQDEPVDYGLTDEEEDFLCSYVLWKRFNSDGYKRKGFTEDDFILAEMEYEEYLESQKQ